MFVFSSFYQFPLKSRFLQLMFSHDVAQCSSIVNVSDKTCKYTNLISISSFHKVFYRIAYTIITAKSSHMYFLYAIGFNDIKEFLCAGFVCHNGIFVYCYIFTFCEHHSLWELILYRLENRLVDRCTSTSNRSLFMLFLLLDSDTILLVMKILFNYRK